MVRNYLHQKATYKEFLNKKDNFGSPLYGVQETISCIKFSDNRYIRKQDTSELTSVVVYITEKKVKVKDMIDGKIIKSSAELYDLRGNYSHTEAIVE